MTLDAEEHRRASLEAWEAAAPGWVHRQREISAFGAPVSHQMVEAIDPQPGQRLLELAAGLGETGMLAAELVAPVGSVIISDQAEAMVEGARARAAGLGIENVEFKVFGAEWIDLPVASVDAVLCRWGYMLMADPDAALGETRRVLRPGGRLALAVWDALAANPWASLPAEVLFEHGAQAPDPDQPGPFSLGSVEQVTQLLEQTGFTEIEVQGVDVVRRHPDFEDFWETTLDISRSLHDLVLQRPAEEIAQIRAAVAARLADYTASDGAVEVPGRSLVAVASA
jgi:ubiquinone/menaquinone biosynthesis C-methylase UbiE